MTSFEDASSAHGTALADYVEASVFTLSSYQRRYLRDWRNGFRPSFYEVDRLLTRMGLHVSQLPECVWSDAAPTPLDGCVVCGKPTPDHGGRPSRYCSRTCEVLHPHGLPAPRPRPTKHCERCGAEYERDINYSNAAWDLRRFCGHECRLAARKGAFAA